MPTIANAGRLTGTSGAIAEIDPAKAAPNVAPMNSEGEKMPPDEPEPRLIDVAASLHTSKRASRATIVSRPVRMAWIVA